jgi:hypothetical protein
MMIYSRLKGGVKALRVLILEINLPLPYGIATAASGKLSSDVKIRFQTKTPSQNSPLLITIVDIE